MSDLVEKLRSYDPTSGYSRWMVKAADEIESLQARNDRQELIILALKARVVELEAILYAEKKHDMEWSQDLGPAPLNHEDQDNE